MRIDDDRDLAEQVESALRALGIASTRSFCDQSDRIVDAVSALRAERNATRIAVSDTLQDGQDGKERL